jgi:integrase
MAQRRKIMSRNLNYTKVKGVMSIWKHKKTGHFLVEKKLNGKTHSDTFETLFEAKDWRKKYDGTQVATEDSSLIDSHASLNEVWGAMQKHHFPTLATSTKRIWLRRYELLKSFEHLPMSQITPTKITSWVNYWTDYYRSELYTGSGRGNAGRCNLNNELNLLVTIFNWYKESEIFEKEAVHLTCPVKRKHRKLGFIKPLPDKRMQIDLENAFIFFEYLKPLYRDLSMLQFYTAARIGEVAGLQWSTVDLKNRRMLIKYACIWDDHKKFLELKPFPKNKEPRPAYITDELYEILKRQEAFRLKGCDYVFHVDGEPLNYGTILVNYREAQRKSGVPYSGTHILRHGMAKLARKVAGGLDAVMAMTGHKDIKLANHYSKCTEDDQKEYSEIIMKHIRESRLSATESDKVISISRFKQKSSNG